MRKVVIQMSNLYRNQELYNKDLKFKFLKESTSCENIEEQKKGTVIFYKYVFQISSTTEDKLNKDIYDFKDHELRSLLNSYKNGSITSAQSVKSVLKQYLDYCVHNGYIEVNLLQDLSGYDDLIQFVDKTAQEQKYISREQFEELIIKSINFQDKFSIAMPWYGFKGEKNCEIINLKVSDVNEAETTIYIENRNKIYKIDDYLMNIIIGAIKEDEYKKLLLIEDSKSHNNINCKIYPNDYVMRVSGKQVNEPAKQINVISRLNRIREDFGNEYLTTTSILNSGMLEELKKVYAKKGELEKKDWVDIGERYGYKEVYWSKNKQKFKDLIVEKKED